MMFDWVYSHSWTLGWTGTILCMIAMCMVMHV